MNIFEKESSSGKKLEKLLNSSEKIFGYHLLDRALTMDIKIYCILSKVNI